jgi:hypothetical protein
MGSAILASVAGTTGSSTFSSVARGAATVSSGLVASVVVAVAAGMGSETTGVVSWTAGVGSVMTWSTMTSAGGAAVVVVVGSWTADMMATVGSGVWF